MNKELSLAFAFAMMTTARFHSWAACGVDRPVPGSTSHASVASERFGRAPNGREVSLYSLRNPRGMEVRITNYGGIVTTLRVPDRAGRFDDVVLGYSDLADYLQGSRYFGALIGRYANRIAHGKFILNGVVYTLATNNGSNALHGGRVGFDKVVWKVETLGVTPQGAQLVLTYISQDKEEGYPGTLHVKATYTLTSENALRLDYEATTDLDTVINLTQHSYFNLRGAEHRGDILGHFVTIYASRFTPVDSSLIPTGELRPVADTDFDFRKPTTIGSRIGDMDDQLRFGRGYDHNWVIDKASAELRLDATVYEPTTGRVLKVLSNQPGLQFYTGNFLDGTMVGKGGWRYTARSAFCMEPQHFPDSPNHPEFPSTILKRGQTYRSTIIYSFSTR
jgi:aldose 1-epimerase